MTVASRGTPARALALALLLSASAPAVLPLAEADFPVFLAPLQAPVFATNPAANDGFGYAVAVSGGTLVVTAPFDDDDGINTGSAFVFTRQSQTWVPSTRLGAPDSVQNGRFGAAVALAGNTLVVGAPDAHRAGVAYVFERTGGTWALAATLEPVGHDGKDARFGASVAVTSGRVAVGSPEADDKHPSQGSVHVFVRGTDAWEREARLTASDAGPNDGLGVSVAIDGARLVAGADRDDGAGALSGSAYVFERASSTWTRVAKLTASDAGPADHFGSAVALAGARIAVGAPLDDAGWVDSGSVYVFVHDGTRYTLEDKVTAPASTGGSLGDRFGASVALADDGLVAGAPGDDKPLTDQGSTLVFARAGTTYVATARLTAQQANAGDAFGTSVAVSGASLVAGAFGSDAAGPNAGLAVAFDGFGVPSPLR